MLSYYFPKGFELAWDKGYQNPNRLCFRPIKKIQIFKFEACFAKLTRRKKLFRNKFLAIK